MNMHQAAGPTDEPSNVSLFGALQQRFGDHLPVVFFSKPTLTHIAHTLENAILSNRIPALIFAGFQHADFWQREADRYRMLAEVARRVYVCAHGLPPSFEGAACLRVPLAVNDPLRREWFLLAAAEQLSFVLCGQDHLGLDGDRITHRFETILSFEPEVVSAGLRVAERVIAHYLPEEAESLRQMTAAVQPGGDQRVLSALVTALAARQETLTQELRQTRTELDQAQAVNQQLTDEAAPEPPADALPALELPEGLADFLRRMADSFRTPLSVLNTSLHLLAHTDDPARRRHQIEVLRRQTHLLSRLADAMFKVIWLESQAQFAFRPVSLNDLAQTLSIAVQQMAAQKDQNAVVDLQAAGCIIYADESELYRALKHIAENAVEFTPEGGFITVKTGTRGDFGFIEVHDTGAGISEDDLPRIFDHFYRAHPESERDGLGLGLTLARIIIEKHGGSIEVESAVGIGSTFRVLLPRADNNAAGDAGSLP